MALPKPKSRREKYLARMCGENVDVPAGRTREEKYLEHISKNGSGAGSYTGNLLSEEKIYAKIIDGEMIGWDKIKNSGVPFSVVTGTVNYVGSKSTGGGKIILPFHKYEKFNACLSIQEVQNYSYIYFSNGFQGIKIRANISSKKVSLYNAKDDTWIDLFDTDAWKWLIIKCVYENGVYKIYGKTETSEAYAAYTDNNYASLPFAYECTGDNIISVDRTNVDFYYDIPRISRIIVDGEYEKTYEDNELYNKKIVFTGDSIVHNAGNYAALMNDQEKCQSVNISWGGSVFTRNNTGTMSMYDKLSNVYVEDTYKKNTDIILLEGGVNDALASNSIGTLSDDFTTFDNQTFLGSLEEYFAEIYSKFPTSKKGFIICYKCPSAPNFKDYVTAIISACEKWKIPFLNLYNDSGFLCDIEEQKTLYFKDNTHINDAGYAMILNKIVSFAESL